MDAPQTFSLQMLTSTMTRKIRFQINLVKLRQERVYQSWSIRGLWWLGWKITRGQENKFKMISLFSNNIWAIPTVGLNSGHESGRENTRPLLRIIAIVGCRHSTVDSSVSSILPPRVRLPRTPSKSNLCYICPCIMKRTKINKMEAGFGPFLKKYYCNKRCY